MPASDYRLLAPQRQVGDPSGLETVLGQAMANKLPPELTLGYYLQAQGQRRRQAADFGEQELMHNAMSLAASDRTADYDLLKGAIASPNSAYNYLPPRVLSMLGPQQQKGSLDLSNYTMGKIGAETEQAQAKAALDKRMMGSEPAGIEPTSGLPTGYKPDVNPPVVLQQDALRITNENWRNQQDNMGREAVARIQEAARSGNVQEQIKAHMDLAIYNANKDLEVEKLRQEGRYDLAAKRAMTLVGNNVRTVFGNNPIWLLDLPADQRQAVMEQRINEAVTKAAADYNTMPGVGSDGSQPMSNAAPPLRLSPTRPATIVDPAGMGPKKPDAAAIPLAPGQPLTPNSAGQAGVPPPGKEMFYKPAQDFVDKNGGMAIPGGYVIGPSGEPNIKFVDAAGNKYIATPRGVVAGVVRK